MTQSIESIIEVLQAYKDGQRITDEKGNEPDDVYELLRWLGYKWNVVAKKKVKLVAFIDSHGELRWFLNGVLIDKEWIRAPSEDKEIEI